MLNPMSIFSEGALEAGKQTISYWSSVSFKHVIHDREEAPLASGHDQPTCGLHV